MRLPSIISLRALEAIARLGSASAAAAELNLTRSAISHQLKKLEESLGFPLAAREGRGIVLTYEGGLYARDVQRILSDLQEAGRQFVDQDISGRLYVSCCPGFSSFWLCRHISEFLDLYPNVQLHLPSPPAPGDISNSQADLFIAYGIGDWHNAHVEQLAPLHFFPVCNPALIHAKGGLKTPQALSSFRLLHMRDHADWQMWFTAAGATTIDAEAGIVFADAHCAQLACIAAQGIAIGDNLISGDALAKGILVKPFDISIDSHRGYYLVSDPLKLQRPVVQAFCDWLKGRVQSSLYN